VEQGGESRGQGGGWNPMGAKSTGWQRSPAVEKVAGGLAGSVPLPCMGVVSLVCSLGRGKGSRRGEREGLEKWLGWEREGKEAGRRVQEECKL